MSQRELKALAALRLHWAPVPEDVWMPSPFHVDGLHRGAERTVSAGLDDAAASIGPSPIGVALIGQGGAGKTHFLGWTRQQIQDRGGYFFLIELVDPTRFWDSAMASILEGLAVRPATGGTQLRMLLQRLIFRTDLAPEQYAEILGGTELTLPTLDSFVNGLRVDNPQLVRECQDTLRALVLYNSVNPLAQDVAQTFLTSCAEREPGERAVWRIRQETRPAEFLLRDVSRILAVTGPAVIAVDQLDPVFAQLRTAGDEELPGQWQHLLQLNNLAANLMQLRETTRRTLTVVACLPETWELVRRRAISTVMDRFREANQLSAIPDEATGRALVSRRFSPQFSQVGFDPPYETWPIHPDAFALVTTFTPRLLLKRVDAHIRHCVDSNRVIELRSLDDEIATAEIWETAPRDGLAAIDDLFSRLQVDAKAEVAAALDPVSEDEYMPPLLSAGLRAWTIERRVTDHCEFDIPTKGKPLLHARLRVRTEDGSEREDHFAFRAVSAEHWRTVTSKIENARLKAGHDGSAGRSLFLLRPQGGPWPTYPSVQKALVQFEQAGGRRLGIAEKDLRVFAALRMLLENNPDGLANWLSKRTPAGGTTVLREALGDPDGFASEGPASPVPDLDAPARPEPGLAPEELNAPARAPSSTAKTRIKTVHVPPMITIGVAQDPLRIELSSLRKHVALFAGSGSGKTVLIRRLVEECALHGVSAIVLDPNNDLARLGDPWPHPPVGWGPDDPARAGEYLANTDVVIWTPRWEAGRPLAFQPLPDLAATLYDPDEFSQAVDVAVAALAPRAKVDGGTVKATHSRAVLTEALRAFAKQGRSGLGDFVGFLGALPEGASRMTQSAKLAAEMAETLTAAMVNDPLFGGGGTPLDPGVLLTPAEGKKARVSVISFVGLPSDNQRQSFVNQLQMALFAWVKRHPAGDRPLGGLFVMDEAQTLAPSGAMTPCTASTVALASQARKYGLGLVFATQAPKGLHNRIPGNASTQFFGLLNSPVQIAAARDLAHAKGGDMPDVGRLGAGQFYVALEGTSFVKAQTPLCLTHHPASPLTTEEVVQRARASVDRTNVPSVADE
ncbi:ATP-binding protein [Paractinoplanes brasiliensis]|uniref:Uncharacterized protein DUF87 n=1 Tax=Paractinoplanes brasiliensis TaxID=52695 RepID=A0A4R6JA71_9ACTN|nr:DUF87 domain-containing protein [Actinoplanes brasiliensis]TDO32560.1 uncharacterized protein DUF87 [Actinoplanes brasiliensis]GID27563.1 ATPase [Actinoplanes brasiliensis]